MPRPPTITVKVDEDIAIYPREYRVGDIWYGRYRIHNTDLNDGKRYVVESLKTQDKNEAVWKAKERYLEIKFREKTNQVIKGKLVKDAIKDFLNWYETGVRLSLPGSSSSSGTFSTNMLKHYRKTIERYWLEYIGDLELNMVSFDHFSGYEGWRRTYYKRKQEQGIRLHGNSKDDVSPRTLQMDIRCMKTCLRWAKTNRYYEGPDIDFTYKAKRNKRHAFTLEQYRHLVRYMRTDSFYQKGKHGNDRLIERSRHQIRSYILFMANTGIRPGTEVRAIRWRDISFVDEGDLKYVRVQVSSSGKKKQRREVIGRYTARRALERLRETRTDNLGPDDYVFCDRDGRQIDHFRDIFDAVIKEADVVHYFDGSIRIKHTPYSLRHTYATFRLRYTKNPNLMALALNMGTSVGMIEEYYSDAIPRDFIGKLV